MGLSTLGFNHLPQEYVFGTPTKCYGLQAAGIGAVSFWAAGVGDDTTGNMACLRLKDGYIQMGKKPGQTAICAGKSTIPFKDLIGGASVQPNKVIVGFRCVRFNAAFGAAPIFSISADQYNGQPYLGLLPVVMNELTDVLNVSQYYEVAIDLIGRTWDVYTDKVKTSSGALDARITKANFASLYWQMGALDRYFVNLTTENSSLWGINSIYVNVATDTVGDTVAEPLGPVNVTFVPVKTDNGAPWPVVGAASIPAAVNTPRTTTGTLASPYINHDAAKTPLKLKLDPAKIPGTRIFGVTANFSAFTQDGSPVEITGKLTHGGVSTPTVSVVASNTAPLVDTKIASLNALPNGGTLTKAALADLDIELSAV